MIFYKAINNRASLFLFLGLFLLSGCTSVSTLIINVEKPAQITLPKNINTVVIVDNSVPQPGDVGHISYIRGKESVSSLSANTDSINYILAASLFNHLGDKEYFDDVVFYEHPLREDINFADLAPLDSILVKNICNDNRADAIISIDRFLVSTVSQDEDFDFGTILKYLSANMDVRFRMYSNKGEAISSPLFMGDSIYWAATYNNNIPLSDDTIPSREQAMKEAAEYMGKKIADSLAPYWSNELRWYFGDVKEAKKSIQDNNWAGALSLWQAAYDQETKNKKKKARLANNIALAYEVSDNLKEAIRWVTISCDLFSQTEETSMDRENLQRANGYKSDLLARYNDFKLLNIRRENSE